MILGGMFAWIYEFGSNLTLEQEVNNIVWDLHYNLLFCYNVFVLKNCQNLRISTKKGTFSLDIVSQFLIGGEVGKIIKSF